MYMNREEFDRKLECLLPGGVLREEPMSRHTTFRIGGPAEWYIAPPVSLLPQLLSLAAEHGAKITVIGNGSNLLVADAGIRGIVIEIGKAAGQIVIEPEAADAADITHKAPENQEGEYAAAEEAKTESTRMRIGAGALLSKAARVAADAGLSGMEFAAGIPGSLGGAVVMNAGAYGGEMKDILAEVTVLTPEGEYIIFSRAKEGLPGDIEYRDFDELELSYRHSVIPERNYIVVEAVVELTPAPKDDILARMAELRDRRTAKQPLEYPSAGSTFKRPQGYFAGKLIEDAGLKGYTVGGAQVSQKHSGFVINITGATAADVRQLIADVQDRVMEHSGVLLEPEVRMVGDF